MNKRFRAGMASPTRTFIFDWYVWMTVIGGCTVAIVALVLSKSENLPGHLLAICTISLGVIYFIQKQKSEDLQLFEKLFTTFNERYREMHPRLAAAIADPNLPDEEFRATFDGYFNLCAEEFLFFQEGRILPSVWRAWCRGMLAYLANDRIGNFFRNEERTGSHYGLTLRAIEAGAGESLGPRVS